MSASFQSRVSARLQNIVTKRCEKTGLYREIARHSRFGENSSVESASLLGAPVFMRIVLTKPASELH
jgi:hypothetical protein